LSFKTKRRSIGILFIIRFAMDWQFYRNKF